MGDTEYTPLEHLLSALSARHCRAILVARARARTNTRHTMQVAFVRIWVAFCVFVIDAYDTTTIQPVLSVYRIGVSKRKVVSHLPFHWQYEM